MGEKNEAVSAEDKPTEDKPADEEQASQAEAGAGGQEQEEVTQPPESDELQQEIARLREALMRTRADMDNMQKRAERDMDRARRYQHEAIMRDLLPVIDGLEQGLENASEGDSAREGLELTRKLLLKALEDHGLEVLNPEGERFDPDWHEAMSMQASEEAEADTVLMVLQKGYRLNERLLRPARVIVASGS